MKMTSPTLHLLALLALCFLGGAGCQPGRRLTKANVDQVAEGMARKQVESILGLPTSVEMKDFAAAKKTTYLYAQGKDTVIVIFQDDKVASTETTLVD